MNDDDDADDDRLVTCGGVCVCVWTATAPWTVMMPEPEI
jgi:hypothetical protein